MFVQPTQQTCTGKTHGEQDFGFKQLKCLKNIGGSGHNTNYSTEPLPAQVQPGAAVALTTPAAATTALAHGAQIDHTQTDTDIHTLIISLYPYCYTAAVPNLK